MSLVVVVVFVLHHLELVWSCGAKNSSNKVVARHLPDARKSREDKFVGATPESVFVRVHDGVQFSLSGLLIASDFIANECLSTRLLHLRARARVGPR